MSDLRVTNLKGRTAGSAPTLPDGAVVTGVATATSFSGNLTGDVTGNVTGNISGATGSFTGNVSVGGTLTYEDVTNVDSVGIITAQAGIKIGAGQSVSAVSGTITYYGDGSQLEGIQSGTLDFVGFGTGITTNKAVIIRSDGKIGAVTGQGVADPSAGTAAVFESGGAIRLASIYHAARNKVIIGFADHSDSSKGKAVAMTITGGNTNTVAAGSVYEFEAGDTRFLSMAYDPDTERVIYHYCDNDNNGNATYRVGTVASDGTLSFGSNTSYYSAAMGGQSAAVYDTNDNRIILMWPNGNSELRSTTGTVDSASNTLNLGSTQGVHSVDADYLSGIWHSGNNRVIIFYRNGNDSGKGYYDVGEHNGNTGSSDGQTWGDVAAFTTGGASYISAVYDSNSNRVVVAYGDDANSNNGYAVVGSLSGNVITWGTPVVFNSIGATTEISTTFDSTNNRVLIGYKNGNNSNYCEVIAGTVTASDNSISFSDKIVINSLATSGTTFAFDASTQRGLIGFNNGGTSGNGQASVIQGPTGDGTNITTENFLGLAAAGISSGSTGSVTIPGGVNAGHSGLTTGRTYYVQNNGTLGLSADNPSVIAGTSISSTQILVR